MNNPRRIASLAELGGYLREDYHANHRSLAPGFQAVAIYRFGVWCEGIPNRLLRKPLRIIHAGLSLFSRNFYGIELYAKTRIGRRFRIVHQGGIVIHPRATIGDDCLIRQGVTIGAGVRANEKKVKFPVIGNRVEFGPGAMVIGPVTVGDDVAIAANAVVTTNVPAGSIVAPPRCRIFTPPPRKRSAQPEIAPGGKAGGVLS